MLGEAGDGRSFRRGHFASGQFFQHADRAADIFFTVPFGHRCLIQLLRQSGKHERHTKLRAKIHRQADYGYDKVEASLPAVLSVVEKINEPRYPSFKGIMAAKKKPVETLSLADAGVDPARVGLAASASEVVSFAKRPPRQAGTIVKDEGDGGGKAAEFLAAQKFI